MASKSSSRKRAREKTRYGSSKKRKRKPRPPGPSRGAPPALDPKRVAAVLSGTAVGQLLSLMFSAIRAESKRVHETPGPPDRMRVLMFNAQVMEALVHTRDAYCHEQEGHPLEPQLGQFFQPITGQEAAEANGEDVSPGGIILPRGFGG